jgi:hypothetical protein
VSHPAPRFWAPRQQEGAVMTGVEAELRAPRADRRRGGGLAYQRVASRGAAHEDWSGSDAGDPVPLHQGRTPRNEGRRYRQTRPSVEEIIAVTRACGSRPECVRLRAIIVVPIPVEHRLRDDRQQPSTRRPRLARARLPRRRVKASTSYSIADHSPQRARRPAPRAIVFIGNRWCGPQAPCRRQSARRWGCWRECWKRSSA